MGIAISAKKGTLAKDHTFPVKPGVRNQGRQGVPESFAFHNKVLLVPILIRLKGVKT